MINLQQSHSFCSHHSWTWALSHRAACTSHTFQLHTDNLNSKTIEKHNHSDAINFMYVELLDREEKQMMEGKWGEDGSSVTINIHSFQTDKMYSAQIGQQLGWQFIHTGLLWCVWTVWKWYCGCYDHLFMCEWVRSIPKYQANVILFFVLETESTEAWLILWIFLIPILNWKLDHLSVTYLKLANKNDSIVYLIIYHGPMLDWSKRLFFFWDAFNMQAGFVLLTPSAWYHTTSAEDRTYI